jgi:hypothetical protein
MQIKLGASRVCMNASTILPTARSMQMMDVIMLALGLGFFALTVGYAFACDRL